jgi:hypothetical protein
LTLLLYALLLLCRGQLAAAAEELSEHRELQMTHDKLCQDVYRMRMMLQQAQSHGNDVAQVCCVVLTMRKEYLQMFCTRVDLFSAICRTPLAPSC